MASFFQVATRAAEQKRQSVHVSEPLRRYWMVKCMVVLLGPGGGGAGRPAPVCFQLNSFRIALRIALASAVLARVIQPRS